MLGNGIYPGRVYFIIFFNGTRRDLQPRGPPPFLPLSLPKCGGTVKRGGNRFQSKARGNSRPWIPSKADESGYGSSLATFEARLFELYPRVKHPIVCSVGELGEKEVPRTGKSSRSDVFFSRRQVAKGEGEGENSLASLLETFEIFQRTPGKHFRESETLSKHKGVHQLR